MVDDSCSMLGRWLGMRGEGGCQGEVPRVVFDPPMDKV